MKLLEIKKDFGAKNMEKNLIKIKVRVGNEIISKNRTYVQKIEKYLNSLILIKIKMLEILDTKVKAKIMKYIAFYNNEITASTIAKELGISKSRASEVLKELERKGVLTSKKIGKSIVYKLNENNEKVAEMISFIKKITLNDIEKIKREIIPILKKHNVIKAGIFGSVVRGEAKENSDIDILVEIPKEKSLVDIIKLENELKEKLKRNVDVIEYSSVHPLLKERVFKEEVRVYEKR